MKLRVILILLTHFMFATSGVADDAPPPPKAKAGTDDVTKKPGTGTAGATPIQKTAPVANAPAALEQVRQASDGMNGGSGAPQRAQLNDAFANLSNVNNAINAAAASGKYDNKDYDKLKTAMAMALMAQGQPSASDQGSKSGSSSNKPRAVQPQTQSTSSNGSTATATGGSSTVNVSISGSGSSAESSIPPDLARELAGSNSSATTALSAMPPVHDAAPAFTSPDMAADFIRLQFQVNSTAGPAASIGKDIGEQLTKDIAAKNDSISPQEVSPKTGTASASQSVAIDEKSSIGAQALAALNKALEDGTLQATVKDSLENSVAEAKKNGKQDPLADAVAAAQGDPTVYNALVDDLSNAIFQNAKSDIAKRFSITGSMVAADRSNRPGAFGKRVADKSGLRGLLPDEKPSDSDRELASHDEAGVRLPGGVPWQLAAVILGGFILYCVYVVGFSGRSREDASSNTPPDHRA